MILEILEAIFERCWHNLAWSCFHIESTGGEKMPTNATISLYAFNRRNHTANSEEYGAGYHTIAAETSDDNYESELRVADPEPPELVVSAVELPEIGSHDESLSGDIELHNRGDLTAEQSVTLSVDGDIVASREITLEGGNREDISMYIDEEVFFSGHYRVDIETEDDSVNRDIEIENPNPYGKETLTVCLNQKVPARHDIDQIVQEALSYWENKSEQYAGYPVEYKYRPNTSDPDVEISLVEEIRNCGGNSGDGIAGCAHYVQESAPSTVEISLVDGYRQEWMTTILKHELGHTLGIGHGEEPAHIMSDDIEDRIPDYRARNDAIGQYTGFFDPYGNGQDALSNALDAYGRRDYAASESAAIDSANYFETARSRVIDTRRTANRLDESDAYALAEETAEHIYLLRLTAEETIEMAREAAYRGNPEPHRQAAMDYLEKAERYQLHEPSELMRAFGLPVKE
ncbi:hypothetical protein HWV07_15565 [Natronomonas salina]|uniref:matrixin family metalloprotease n=1 Tax=Natronomonas salina TaxID=1710540 RepID=UPI0015B78552|nr:matrixin family metalloprotease [Natronomonas salina]QLD90377.1 hypothetical protein HWV07_15565 [Natronomonas salina]